MKNGNQIVIFYSSFTKFSSKLGKLVHYLDSIIFVQLYQVNHTSHLFYIFTLFRKAGNNFKLNSHFLHIKYVAIFIFQFGIKNQTSNENTIRPSKKVWDIRKIISLKLFSCSDISQCAGFAIQFLFWQLKPVQMSFLIAIS